MRTSRIIWKFISYFSLYVTFTWYWFHLQILILSSLSWFQLKKSHEEWESNKCHWDLMIIQYFFKDTRLPAHTPIQGENDNKMRFPTKLKDFPLIHRIFRIVILYRIWLLKIYKNKRDFPSFWGQNEVILVLFTFLLKDTETRRNWAFFLVHLPSFA